MESIASTSAPGVNNPYAHSIESIISCDMSLLEQKDGQFQLIMGQPPNHPDTILFAAADNSRNEASTPPSPARLLSSSNIINNYKQLFEASSDKPYPYIRQMIMAQVPSFTRAPQGSLVSTTLSDMLLNQIHKGKYLLCRVIHESVRVVAIQAAIEDQNGDVADLALYNCFETKDMTRSDISSLLPVGTVILVREPWFKLGATGGHPTIRVDSPTDISFPTHAELLSLDPPASWRPSESLTADDYKLIGNKFHEKRHYEAALRAYASGLSIDPSASLLRLNRAWCHLKLGNPTQALNDARVASEDKSLTEEQYTKARYRMALASYDMDRFSDALGILKQENLPNSWSQIYKGFRTKCEARLKEQTTGEYDWYSLHKTSVQKPNEMLGIADYIGPVDFVEMPERPSGKGVITTRAVEAGELLFVTKPFAFASTHEFPNDLLRAMVLQDKTVNDRPYYELIGRIVRRLVGNRTASSALFLALPTTEDKVSEASSPTSFVDLVKKGVYPHTASSEHEVGDINVEKIQTITKAHQFQEPVEGVPQAIARSICLAPAFVNHSCNGSGVRSSIGSVYLMRASRNLAKGEEITCSHIGGHDVASYFGREGPLSRWLERCDCSLCEADRKDGIKNCKQRERYYEQLSVLQTLLAPGDPLKNLQVQQLVEMLEGTYLKDREEPMDALGFGQRLLGYTYQGIDSSKAYDAYAAALKSYGIRFKVNPPLRVPANRSQMDKNSLIIHTDNFPSQIGHIDVCIRVMNTLAGLKHRLGQKRLAGHWAVAALWTHETFCGPGKEYLWETLRVRWSDVNAPSVVYLNGF